MVHDEAPIFCVENLFSTLYYNERKLKKCSTILVVKNM
jgi:hypothetical protein